LLYRVRESIAESGFCIFGAEDMERLFSTVKGGSAAKRQALEEFATLSGARMETTPNLNSARFDNSLSQSGTNLILHSPVHPDTTMQLTEIEPGLFAYACQKSNGVWIPRPSYLDWKAHHKNDKSELPAGYVPEIADDSRRPALICPESGRLLIRYRVGHGLKFHVDFSAETGGMWLDRGEWEALKSKGLHVELNLVFTASYQRQIRNEEHEKALEETFRERIGQEDFEKVAAFKQWLAAHSHQRSIRCYLLYNLRDHEE
jgi:Zn-finger nucleic acid-binding protein